MVTFAKLVPHLRLGLVFVLGFGLGRNFFLLPSFGAGTLQVHESLRTTLAPDPQLELPALNASACTKSKRVGNSGDGGWDVCLDDLPATGCVVYSGGISDSASFDEAISAQPFGCEVHGFDPTLGANLAAMSERFRRGGMHLHDWGLGGTDFVYPAGTAPWVWPGAGYGAFSNPAAWQFYALQTAMAELGHEKLAVFKCDIEGGEWPLLERLLSDSRARTMLSRGGIRQIMFEVHFMPRPDAGLSATSARHPTSAALVDAFNLHARDLLHQLSGLGFVLWKADTNGVSPPLRSAASSPRSCHELYFVWRGAPPARGTV